MLHLLVAVTDQTFPFPWKHRALVSWCHAAQLTSLYGRRVYPSKCSNSQCAQMPVDLQNVAVVIRFSKS